MPTGTTVVSGGYEDTASYPVFLSEANGNTWVVAGLMDSTVDTTSDLVAIAQCYNPRGTVSGAFQANVRTSSVKDALARALAAHNT